MSPECVVLKGLHHERAHQHCLQRGLHAEPEYFEKVLKPNVRRGRGRRKKRALEHCKEKKCVLTRKKETAELFLSVQTHSKAQPGRHCAQKRGWVSKRTC